MHYALQHLISIGIARQWLAFLRNASISILTKISAHVPNARSFFGMSGIGISANAFSIDSAITINAYVIEFLLGCQGFCEYL